MKQRVKTIYITIDNGVFRKAATKYKASKMTRQIIPVIKATHQYFRIPLPNGSKYDKAKLAHTKAIIS